MELDPNGVRVSRLLSRKSVFTRVAARQKMALPLIATNIDILIIVTSRNEEFKASRLERYPALAQEARVTPVAILTKRELAIDADSFVGRVLQVRPDLSVVLLNARDPTIQETF